MIIEEQGNKLTKCFILDVSSDFLFPSTVNTINSMGAGFIDPIHGNLISIINDEYWAYNRFIDVVYDLEFNFNLVRSQDYIVCGYPPISE